MNNLENKQKNLEFMFNEILIAKVSLDIIY